jgi:hypothetical protein
MSILDSITSAVRERLILYKGGPGSLNFCCYLLVSVIAGRYYRLLDIFILATERSDRVNARDSPRSPTIALLMCAIVSVPCLTAPVGNSTENFSGKYVFVRFNTGLNMSNVGRFIQMINRGGI